MQSNTGETNKHKADNHTEGGKEVKLQPSKQNRPRDK